LVEAPLLRTPNKQLPYDVVTDASDLGLGAMLLQEDHSVAFESRKLNSNELNYETREREMLAVVHMCSSCVAVLSGRCKVYLCRTPISRRKQTCHDGKHDGWSFCSVSMGLSSGSIAKDQKRGRRIEPKARRDVAGSVRRFCCAAQFAVVGTAGAVAAGYQETFWRITIPGQGEDVSNDQGSAKILTSDLSF
jgi:hypothetical protein